MYLGLAGTLDTQGPEGVLGILGGVGVVWGHLEGVRGVLGAHRDGRYSEGVLVA